MALYLNILTVVLLALVAGLLLTLYFQLKEWRAVNREAPLLAEKLAEAMLTTRKGLADLKQELVGQGPELNRLMSEGGKLRVELQYLLQRASQIADKLDETADETEIQGVRLSPAAQAVVEQVAGVNGRAAATMARHSAADPLEELLTGLQQTEPAEEPIKRSKRKRVGPVTQAELDLQQSLNKGAV